MPSSSFIGATTVVGGSGQPDSSRRTPDPADRRGVLVRLTPRGSKVARQALHELITTNQAFLEPLNGQQRDSIASALRQLLLHHEPR